MPGDPASTLASAFSSTSTPDSKAKDCPPTTKKVVTLKWELPETWCSEPGPISGTTVNYSDGEAIAINVTDKDDGSAITTLNTNVAGNAFRSEWKRIDTPPPTGPPNPQYGIIDVLPKGGPSWVPRRRLEGEASGVKTPKLMSMRFIPNLAKVSATGYKCNYNVIPPAPAPATTATITCDFSLDIVNYLLTMYGIMNYCHGRAGERLFLNNPALNASGGFTYNSATWHMGYQNALGAWLYWNGTAFVATPATFVPGQNNHFGFPFVKSNGNWVCRDVSGLNWPVPWTDWAPATYTGPGNARDTVLATWKNNIDTRWTDRFDIKRVECKSTKPECCRYKTQCISTFIFQADQANASMVLLQENVRSDSGAWSMGDTRAGLAPHEFGHLLGAPDEYPGVFSTQLGVSDSDGLVSGIDNNCLMGIGLSLPKKRHYKGIVEALALAVKKEFGKTYTYQAVAKGTTLASPAGTPPTPDPGPGVDPAPPAPGHSDSAEVLGAIIGGAVGAAAGAAAGYFASGGSGGWAAGAGVGGAVLGAAAGAAIGKMF